MTNDEGITNDEPGERGRLARYCQSGSDFRRPRRKAPEECPARRVTQRPSRPRSSIRRSTFVLRHFLAGFLALTWLVMSSDNLAEPKPARPEHTNRLAREKSP